MRAEQIAMIEIAQDFILMKDAGRDGEDRMDLSAGRFKFLTHEGKVTRL